jgi:hypothetical protein
MHPQQGPNFQRILSEKRRELLAALPERCRAEFAALSDDLLAALLKEKFYAADRS